MVSGSERQRVRDTFAVRALPFLREHPAQTEARALGYNLDQIRIYNRPLPSGASGAGGNDDDP
jgi:hypothetical protein